MFTINVDLSQIEGLMNTIDAGIKKEANKAANDLAQMVKERAIELAGQKLHTRREAYVKGLKVSEVSEDTHVVSLDAKVRWIDDGQSTFDMLTGLLNTKKQNHKDKDGNRYVIVPFEHGKGGVTRNTAAQQELVNTVKAKLKDEGVPFTGIEKNADGSAKTGRLHTFNIEDAPRKLDAGPGQRRGPVGEVMQGNTNVPFLRGVSVYQSVDGKGKAQRSIVTFRIASEKHRSQGKWEHPGNAATDILEAATKWAIETWEKEVAPSLVGKITVEKG